VIRTGNEPGAPIASEQFVSTVLAHIVEGPQFSVGIARRKYALSLDFRRNVTARIFQLVFVTQVLPGFVKDLLAFDIQKPGITITDLVY
jgi:hypothetical protein